MKKKVSEAEETEMYRIVSDALFALCDKKPTNPVEFLARKLLELVGDENPEFSLRTVILFIKMINF